MAEAPDWLSWPVPRSMTSMAEFHGVFVPPAIGNPKASKSETIAAGSAYQLQLRHKNTIVCSAVNSRDATCAHASFDSEYLFETTVLVTNKARIMCFQRDFEPEEHFRSVLVW